EPRTCDIRGKHGGTVRSSDGDPPAKQGDEPRRNPYAPPPEGAPLPPPRAPDPREQRPGREQPDRPSPSKHAQGTKPEHESSRPTGPGGPNDPRRPAIEPPMEQLKELGRSLAWFAGAMLLTFLTSQLPLPGGAVAPVFGIVTVVLGVRAIVRSRRISTRNLLTPMAIVGIVLALLLTVG